MLGFLIALVLLALAVCAVVPTPLVAAIVTAGTVAAIAPSCSARTDCAVAARSAADTARSGREDREECAGGGPARLVRDLPAVTSLRVLRVVPRAFRLI